MADRTQTPVGAGYAVENRIVISRMLPHVFHHCQVQRLAGFFIALRETLAALAAHRRESPHTVLLSPGPASPTYFEDAYLARYLGYTLVEGEDLTVRDNRVYLKTLGGLIPTSTSSCGACATRTAIRLELDGSSTLGRAGPDPCRAPRQCARWPTRWAAVCLEAPALMAFLPALCRRLLGEELQLPSAFRPGGAAMPSRWRTCSITWITLVDSPGGPRSGDPAGSRAHRLDSGQREELAARIKARPEKFVAQELVVRSTAPVWSDGALRPGHVALAHVRGGVGRLVSGDARRAGACRAPRAGAGRIDVRRTRQQGRVGAVRRSRRAGHAVAAAGHPIAPRRSGNDLPSRVADNLFWLGRHVERAEAAARLLRSIFTRLISESSPERLARVASAVSRADRAMAPAGAGLRKRPQRPA